MKNPIFNLETGNETYYEKIARTSKEDGRIRGTMTKCKFFDLPPSEQEKVCKFFTKASYESRCMYLREDMDWHCDCMED